MKSIIIIILVSLTCSVKAQSTICPALNAFTGEWRYIHGSDTIRVYLRANDYTITGDGSVTIAKLWGWHEYKQGNVVVASDYNNRFMTLPTNSDNVVETSYSISLQLPQCSTYGQKILGTIADINQCREAKPVIIIFNSAQNQLTWSQRSRTGFGYGTGCYGMTLPRNFVLTKQ